MDDNGYQGHLLCIDPLVKITIPAAGALQTPLLRNNNKNNLCKLQTPLLNTEVLVGHVFQNSPSKKI